MGILADDKRQLNYIYHPNMPIGKQGLGYLQGMEDSLLAINLEKTKLSDTHWAEIAESIGTELHNLVEDENLSVDNLSEMWKHDVISIIQNNPEKLKHPIVIKKDEIKVVKNASEVLKFFGVDSAGLDKTLHYEDPTTTEKTSGENFVE